MDFRAFEQIITTTENLPCPGIVLSTAKEVPKTKWVLNKICLFGQMNKQKGEWMDVWTNGQKNRQVDVWMNIDKWIDGQVDRQIDGGVGRWMDRGQMDR